VAITQLSLFNDALFNLGARKLVALSDDVEGQYLLTDAWGSGGTSPGAVAACLEQGFWNFAMLSTAINHTGPENTTGFAWTFTKPSDMIRLAYLCSDDRYIEPLLNYQDNPTTWDADIDPIYVRYVSNGASYGLNYAIWPESFRLYVGWYLAWKIARSLTGSKVTQEDAAKEMKLALRDAKSKDAMKDPPKRMWRSNWTESRYRGYGDRYIIDPPS
jgi:hypothetical protein